MLHLTFLFFFFSNQIFNKLDIRIDPLQLQVELRRMYLNRATIRQVLVYFKYFIEDLLINHVLLLFFYKDIKWNLQLPAFYRLSSIEKFKLKCLLTCFYIKNKYLVPDWITFLVELWSSLRLFNIFTNFHFQDRLLKRSAIVN